MEVQHDVFGGIFLRLFFLEFALAHELERYRDNIADSLDKEYLYLIQDILVELGLDEGNIFIDIFLNKQLAEVKLMLKDLVSWVK